MPASPLRLIKNAIEYCHVSMINEVPLKTRGIYVLYKHRKRLNRFDVVYIGMTDAGVKSRLRSHKRSKGAHWDYFSIFEVWDNVREEEIRELEGILRHIYRTDTHANQLNMQSSFKKLNKLRVSSFDDWRTES